MEKLPALKLDKGLPAHVTAKIDLGGWMQTVFNKVPYTAMDGEAMNRLMLLSLLEAESVEEVLSESVGEKLQEMVPNAPFASTPPLEIFDVGVYPGDAENEPSTYLVIRATDLDSGEQVRLSTGATNIQVQMMRLLTLGVWPIRCCFKRIDKTDQGGRYIFRISLPD